MIVSFFSYKGGAGRTTCALNTAYYLVTKIWKPTPDAPLIIIDADMESSGISYMLASGDDCMGAYLRDDNRSLWGLLRNGNGNVFIPQSSSDVTNSWLQYKELQKFFIPVGNMFSGNGIKVAPESVLLLRAPNLSHEMKVLNDDDQAGRNSLLRVIDIAQTCGCHIIFDTPTGTQALASISLSASNIIVCHMRPTRQFLVGTEEYIMNRILRSMMRRKKLIICPSVVPSESVTIDNNEYPQYYMENEVSRFLRNLETSIGDTGARARQISIVRDMMSPTPYEFQYFHDKLDTDPTNVQRLRARALIGIPEVVRFKWKEGILPLVESLSPEERLACERYYYLAGLINS